METIYNSYFLNEFYEEQGGGNYTTKKKQWEDFFNSIASRIVELYNPKTVLDVGCATGYLVQALRNLGVEAFGFDISEYAISMASPYISPYCFVHSIVEPIPKEFPQKYDLIITIEVLEHLFEEDGIQAISNICGYSDTIIFSSTPSDILDRTHVNVQLREYWTKLFFKNSFSRVLGSDFSFISPWCVMFQKFDDLPRLIHNYEMHVRIDELEHKKALEDEINKITQHNIECKFVSEFKIYFDFGDGFSEDNSNIVQNDIFSEYIRCSINLPKDVLNIRFDPIENQKCIIKNMIIFGDNIRIKEFSTNGIGILNGIMFNTLDPQIIIPNVENISELVIEAEFIRVDDYFLGVYLDNDIAKNEVIVDKHNQILERDEIIVDKHNQILERDEIIQNKHNEIIEINSIIQDKENHIINIENELENLRNHYHAAINQKDFISSQLLTLQYSYNETTNAFFWKITSPARKVVDSLKRNRYTGLIIKGVKSIKNDGIKATNSKVKRRLSLKARMSDYNSQSTLTEEEKNEQSNTKFSKDIKFSIVVPLYNTPERFLIEMIESVVGQTYSNWELCMADGSDKDNAIVGKICKEYTKKDKRIKYKKLEQNLGISENTNACIEMSTGDYIGLFDHDDVLHPSALFYYMQEICDKNADFIYCDELTFENNVNNVISAHFKPDFAIDNLRANNYICHFSVFDKVLLDKVGLFRKEFDGSQDHDMILRLTEKAMCISHVPKMLYYWRSHPNSVASDINSKLYAVDAGKKAVLSHLERMNIKAIGIESTKAHPAIYRVLYELMDSPLVSIIIPNKDNYVILKKCIDSIIQKSTYHNYEIIIVENNSTEDEIFEYYNEIETINNIRIVYFKGEFNYSKANNFGFGYAKGEYIILLNNDIEVITPNWIEEMLVYCQRDDVGVVGAKLYYSNDTIQHAGVILGLKGTAGHHYLCADKDNVGYMGRLYYAQNFTAVTAACLMIKKLVFDEVNGLDEDFKLSFNDVDLCMRVRKSGYLICWTPFAELYHYESIYRGYNETPDKIAKFLTEVELFQTRWKKELDAGDPYYNINLTLDRPDFSLR